MDNTIINKKYLINYIINKGHFGQIYKGINIKNNQHIAAKLEFKNKLCTIKNEAVILKYLQDNKCFYVPLIHWYGVFNNFYVLILPFYECNLLDIINNYSFSINKIKSYAYTMLNIIQHIHELLIIHRDIKPEHFMISNNKLFLVDFGLSTFYVDHNNQVLPNNTCTQLIGSSNYASFFLYDGNNYSKRDDLISILYVLLFMANKHLPWEKININSNIINNNENIQIKNLKHYDNLLPIYYNIHPVFANLLSFCYQLDYYDNPNYNLYLNLCTKRE